VKRNERFAPLIGPVGALQVSRSCRLILMLPNTSDMQLSVVFAVLYDVWAMPSRPAKNTSSSLIGSPGVLPHQAHLPASFGPKLTVVQERLPRCKG
jgi:hypothetical protein